MVWPRLSICQDCAAPLPMTSITLSMSRPARPAEVHALGEPLHQAGDADLVDHLGELAGAGGPIRVTARAKASITGRARAKALPRRRTSPSAAPFSAPAWPPETGASMKCDALLLADAASSRATSAEAVVCR
jgi:hypothetical protein